MKILLIEDEVKLAEYLRRGLGEASYVSGHCVQRGGWPRMALEGSYDLRGAGRNAAGDRWFQPLTAFRKTKQTPVLMLTARVPRRGSGIGTQDGCRRLSGQALCVFQTERPHPGAATADHGAQDAAEPTQLRLADLELDLVRRKASRRESALGVDCQGISAPDAVSKKKGECFLALRSLNRCGT